MVDYNNLRTNKLSVITEESQFFDDSLMNSKRFYSKQDSGRSDRYVTEDEMKIDMLPGTSKTNHMLSSPTHSHGFLSENSSINAINVNNDESTQIIDGNEYSHYIFFVANPRSGNQKAANFLTGVRNFQLSYKSRGIRAFCHIFNVLDQQECSKSYNLIRDRTMKFGSQSSIIVALMGGDGSIM